MTKSTENNEIKKCLNILKLPTMKKIYKEETAIAVKESYDYPQYLLRLLEQECEDRKLRKIERLTRESKLPLEKSLLNFDLKIISKKVQIQFRALLNGDFVQRKENVLAFGIPGSGKTHLLCALCLELILQGKKVLYTVCSNLVQELLIAKRDLKLPQKLKSLGKYEAILIDDIGYVEQSREEMEVLFTLLADRYEKSSILITSNLPFSRWDKIFKDPMTTAAVIDRLIHHSMVIELKTNSYRLEHAKNRK